MDVKRRPLLRPAGVLVPLCLIAALVHCSSQHATTEPGGRIPNPPSAGKPAKLAFEPLPHSVGMGDTLPPVRVDILDSAGHVVTGATTWVTVALGTTRPAAMRGTLTAQAAQGVAVFTTLSIDSPGVYALRAVATGLAGATSDTFLVRPAAGSGPERLAFEAVPASVTAGDTMPPIRVDVLDTAGHVNTSSNVQVNVQLDDNPGHGALHGTTSVNAVRGVATLTRLVIDSAGNGYSLRAIGDGMTGAVSDRFNVAAAPPPPPPGTNTTWSWTPLQVATSQRFAALSVDLGSEHCGITSSQAVWCWGTYASGGFSGAPTQFPMNFAAVVTGGSPYLKPYACGLTADGQAWCWGDNSSGNLGNGTTTSSTVPVPVSGGLRFAQISAGLQTCGLTSAGRLYCWGMRFVKPVGSADRDSINTVPTAVDSTTQYRMVAAGGVHTCALGSDETVRCMGEPTYGATGLGVDQSTGLANGSATMKPVMGNITFAFVAAGLDATCGLAADGAAYCWGENFSGQAGFRHTAGTSYEVSSPTQVPGVPAFKVIRPGGSSYGGWACALTTSGVPWCWGATHNPDGVTADSTTAPVSLPGTETFTALSGGAGSMCGLAGDGTAWCWGSNGDGQLGQGHFSAFDRAPRR